VGTVPAEARRLAAMEGIVLVVGVVDLGIAELEEPPRGAVGLDIAELEEAQQRVVGLDIAELEEPPQGVVGLDVAELEGVPRVQLLRGQLLGDS
jgi:hypothetical protein